MAFLTVDEAVSYILESEQSAAKLINVDLPHEKIRNPQHTRELLRLLGNPDKKQFNIKVTGSKGKGSVSKLIACTLESQGYKVGLFTGPHLLRFNERIRINDEIISDEDLIKYTNEIKPLRDSIMENQPEEHYLGRVGTSLAIALRYFEDNSTDFNVIELGIGAKYDEGNTACADISVINPIFSEHLRELGGTYQSVAEHKSYIIEKGQEKTFFSRQDSKVKEILLERAEKEGVEAKIYDEDFTCENTRITLNGTEFDMVLENDLRIEKLILNMYGNHQADNACLAFAVSKEAMKLKGREDIDVESLIRAYREVTWVGRFEIIGRDPLMILDGGINRECAKHIKETLIEMGSLDNLFIIGVPDDKDYIGTILELKEVASSIILTKARNKSLHFNINQYEKVKEVIGEENLYSTSCIEEAMSLAVKLNEYNKTLCIVGTQSLVADTKRLMNPEYMLIKETESVAL